MIPLAVLIFTYTRIAIAVWGKRPPGEAENSRDQRMARSKRKVSKKAIFIAYHYAIVLQDAPLCRNGSGLGLDMQKR